MTRVDAPKGDRALELREKHGLTLAQIAERIGSNQPTVCTLIKQAKVRRERAAGLAKPAPQWKDGESA